MKRQWTNKREPASSPYEEDVSSDELLISEGGSPKEDLNLSDVRGPTPVPVKCSSVHCMDFEKSTHYHCPFFFRSFEEMEAHQGQLRHSPLHDYWEGLASTQTWCANPKCAYLEKIKQLGWESTKHIHCIFLSTNNWSVRKHALANRNAQLISAGQFSDMWSSPLDPKSMTKAVPHETSGSTQRACCARESSPTSKAAANAMRRWKAESSDAEESTTALDQLEELSGVLILNHEKVISRLQELEKRSQWSFEMEEANTAIMKRLEVVDNLALMLRGAEHKLEIYRREYEKMREDMQDCKQEMQRLRKRVSELESDAMPHTLPPASSWVDDAAAYRFNLPPFRSNNIQMLCADTRGDKRARYNSPSKA